MTTPDPSVICIVASDSDDPPTLSVAESAKTQDSANGRSNGKIARLSKPIRDQINHWLVDGLSYPEIIRRLGDNGKGLKPNNVSQWKKRAHQHWLAQQAFVERTRARQETSEDLVRDFDATQVSQAALQLGTLHVFEAMRDLGPGSLDQKLGGDSAAFARLLNALARASKETLMLQKYREACARARAALNELKDPKRKLNESETRAIVLKVDDILGLRAPEDPPETAVPTEPTVTHTA